MSLKSFITISLIAHSLLFIGLSKKKTASSLKKVRINLTSKTTLPKKSLTGRAKKKTNKTLTKKSSLNENHSASYYKKLINFVQSKAVYPGSALSLKQEGTVVMKLTLLKNGDVIGFKITKNSKFNSLNSATLQLAKNIKKYEPFPENFKAKKVFTIPVNYILN